MAKQTIHDILDQYRAASQTEREKGTYFEELIRTYFRYEANCASSFSSKATGVTMK
jgi:predicted helicase